MTQCLESFRQAHHATPENWERKFQTKWTASSFVDTVLVAIATDLADQLSNFSNARLLPIRTMLYAIIAQMEQISKMLQATPEA